MKSNFLVNSASSCGAFLLVLSGIMTACVSEPTFPNAPQIQFKGFSKFSLMAGTGVGQQKRDSLVITIGFTDGDGNLGDQLPINSDDTVRYKQAGGWGNYKIRTFRLMGNQYVELPSKEDAFLVFPQLERQNTTGPIEGSLDFHQLYFYGTSYKTYPTKFRIQIRDRSLQISNEIETDTVSMPYGN